MANPSDVGPSGAGTEVLRRVQFNGLGDSNQTILTVGQNKIVTILSVVITIVENTAGRNVEIIISPDGSGTNVIYGGLGKMEAQSTFVFNEKVVLTGQTSGTGDVLKVACDSTNWDVYVSYIEQAL